MCSGSTAYTSIKESGLKPGQWALFVGGGSGVGIQGVQLAAAMGLRPIVVDTGDERKALATTLGAEHFVDFQKVKDPVSAVLDLTEGGADGVFITGQLAISTRAKLTSNSATGISSSSEVPGRHDRRNCDVHWPATDWQVQH
jgi:alcohol dehydrogenase, propanol-preferring